MNFRIVHKTEYIYAEPASLCYNEARLLPRAVNLPQLSQVCRNRNLVIEPAHTDIRERVDYFGNSVVYYTIRQPHTHTTITATSEVECRDECRRQRSPFRPRRCLCSMGGCTQSLPE